MARDESGTTPPDDPPQPGRASVPQGLATAAAFAGRLLVIGAAVAVLAWLARTLTLVVVPVLVGILLAGAFQPPVAWAVRKGMPRWAAALVAVLTFLSAVVVVATVVGVRIADQVPQLTEQLTTAVEQAEQRLGITLPEPPGADDGGQGGEAADASGSEPSDAGSSDAPRAGDGAGATDRVESAGDEGETAASALRSAFEILAASFLMLALAFLFIKDGEAMWRWIVTKVDDEHRATVDAAGRSAWATTGAYVRGLTVVALFDAVGVGLGLLVLGVPLVLTLAALQFVLSYIPTFGALIAGAAAVVVAFVSGGLVTAALTLALVILVQQIGNDVIEPWIMGRSLSLHPAVVLVAVAAGGVLWGPPGAFLAVPLVAAGSAAGHAVWERRVDTRS